jgi:hypothetical protein
MAASILLFANAAFAGDPPKAAKGSSENQTINASDQVLIDDVLGGGRCAVAAPSPTPQGTQQIHVCNNFTAPAGANIELFNTTGQSCTLSTGTTAWPFVQSAPLTIADGSGLWVKLLTTLTEGATYSYSINCCPQNTNPKIVVS